MLLRNTAWGERWVALMKLGADLNDGVLPESLSEADIAKAATSRDDSLDTLTAHAIAFSWSFHRHKNNEAGRFLEELRAMHRPSCETR